MNIIKRLTKIKIKEQKKNKYIAIYGGKTKRNK